MSEISGHDKQNTTLQSYSNQNRCLSWVSFIGPFEQPVPGASLLGLAECVQFYSLGGKVILN